MTRPFPSLLRAVLFDLDGTLVDSEPLHFVSTNAVLSAFGAQLDPAENDAFVGWSELDFWTELRRRFGIPDDVGALAAARTQHFLELVRTDGVPVLPGARSLVSVVAARGLPRAVVSASPRHQIDATLEAAGLGGDLPCRVSGHDDVPNSKPAPDAYVEACRRLGVGAEAGIALEDSPSGITAARGAGVFAIGVRQGAAPGADLSAADLMVPSLEDVLPLVAR